MNKEIKERFIEVVSSLLKAYGDDLESYLVAEREENEVTKAELSKEAEMILNEISDLYYIASGEHESAMRIKKIFKL